MEKKTTAKAKVVATTKRKLASRETTKRRAEAHNVFLDSICGE